MGQADGRAVKRRPDRLLGLEYQRRPTDVCGGHRDEEGYGYLRHRIPL
jgi:hypothetical protein